jgi:tetraacyldisaccharide 4'-kinase
MIFFKPKFWDNKKITIFAILLIPLSLLIKFLTLIKFAITKKVSFSIPVICVGNIYLGGTGKTPLSIELYHLLKTLGKNPAFIRKKYKAYKDESELQKSIGNLYENKSRKNALMNAINNKVNVAILDDGFQDLSIKKKISILCFNEKKWIGNGLTIPSGPLREGLSSLKRAEYVMINGERNTNIESKILAKNKDIKIFYIKYKAANIIEFENKKIIALAGIGNPENFFELLEMHQINILKKIKFPDHYNYSDLDLERLINEAKNSNSTLLTTEKDFFRIDSGYRKNFSYLKILVEIKNKEKFIEEIKKII